MTTEIETRSSSTVAVDLPKPHQHPAVARCCAAWLDILKVCRGVGESADEVIRHANEAYRDAMPPLIGAQNIRDFIACTAHGMLVGAIDSSDGARLLYAAQVAHGARHTKAKRESKRKKAL